MRKLTALLMMIVLVFSLAACSNTSSDKENSTHGSVQQGAPQDSENNASELSDSSSPTKTNDGKTLVVYYSASGNTERVAKDIAEVTGADLFEIEPLKPYTDADLNWTNNDSRVSRELMMKHFAMFRLKRQKCLTGIPMIPCLSVIPFGGGSLHGRLTIS